MFIELLLHFILGEEPLVVQKLPRDPEIPFISLWSKLSGLSVAIIHKKYSFIMALICLPFLISCFSLSNVLQCS